MDINVFAQVLVNGVMAGGLYAMVASGFTLILGVMQIFNFAQGYFYMLGSYVTYATVVQLGVPYPIAVLISLVTMGILGVLMHIGILRWTQPDFFRTILACLAFSIIVSQVSMITWGYSEAIGMAPAIRGSLSIGGVVLSWSKILVIGIAALSMFGLQYFLRLKIGKALRATAENTEVAKLQGIDTRLIFWIAMAVGCALCGLAGGLIAPVLGVSVEMGQTIFLRAMLAVIVGGMGSITGCLLAAIIIGIAESFFFHFFGAANLLMIFVGVAVLIYFRPGGLFGKPLPIPGA